MRDALGLDQREGVAGGRRGAEHGRAADREGAEDAGAGEREVVRDRQAGQVDGVAVQFAGLGAGPGVEAVVVVGARDQLRDAGGAAGDQQQSEARRVRVREVPWFGVERGQRGVRAGLAVHQDVAQLGCPGGDLAGEVAVVEARQPVGDDVGDGGREPGQVADLGDPVGGQGEDGHRAEPGEGEEQHGERAGVGQLDEHPVARRDAEAVQTCRQPVGALVELPVGQPLLARHQGEAPSVRRRPVREQPAEGAAVPVAGGGVARGVLGGPRGQPGGQGGGRGGGGFAHR